VLATCVASKGKEVEMPCSSYASSRSLYIFSNSSTRCAECVRHGVRYNGNFSVDDFDYLTIEQCKLKAVRDAILEWVP
jgi:hypothetical protein